MLYRIAVVVALIAIATAVPVATFAGGDASIRINSPNGGEEWALGSKRLIQWEYGGSSFPAPAYYNMTLVSFPKDTSVPTKVYVIRSGGDVPLGFYSWEIPNDVPTGQYIVALGVLVAQDDSTLMSLAYDESDAPFSIVAPAEPPKPAGVVRLVDVVMRTYQDEVTVDLFVMTPGVIAVEVAVGWRDPIMPLIGSRPNGNLVGWSFMEKFDKDNGVLRIAAAGATPTIESSDESARPLLSLVFNTRALKPGQGWFSFPVAIRLNEGPVLYLSGAIRFLPIPGDITVDAEVTAFDGVRVLQYNVGLMTEVDYPALIPEVADVSGNGQIGAYDAALIFRHVAGLLDVFPVDSKEKVSPQEVASRTGVVAATPAAGKPITSESEPARVWLGQMTSDNNGYAIPVVVDQMDGVLAGQLEIGPVDETVILETGKLLEGYQVVTNQQNGKLLVSFAGASSPKGGGEMFRLKFAAKPSRLTAKVQFNEDPAVMLSTAVEQTSWGRIKAEFAR